MKTLIPIIAVAVTWILFAGTVAWTLHQSDSGRCALLQAKHLKQPLLKAFD